MSTKQQRITVRYEGHVQGVGFRFTASSLAVQHAITGWIKNEPTGNVLLVAEGTHQQLMCFLEDLRTSPIGHTISTEQMTPSFATDEFNGFEIRY